MTEATTLLGEPFPAPGMVLSSGEGVDVRKRPAIGHLCAHGLPISSCGQCATGGVQHNGHSTRELRTMRQGSGGVPSVRKRARPDVFVPMTGLPASAYRNVLLPVFSGRLAKDIRPEFEEALLAQVSPSPQGVVSPSPQGVVSIVPELVVSPENQELIREGVPLAALALGAAVRGGGRDDVVQAVHQAVGFVYNVNSGADLAPAVRATLVLIRMLIAMLYSIMGAREAREAMIGAVAADYGKLPEAHNALPQVVGLMGQWAQCAQLGEYQRHALVAVLKGLASYERAAQSWNAQQPQQGPSQTRGIYEQPNQAHTVPAGAAGQFPVPGEREKPEVPSTTAMHASSPLLRTVTQQNSVQPDSPQGVGGGIDSKSGLYPLTKEQRLVVQMPSGSWSPGIDKPGLQKSEKRGGTGKGERKSGKGKGKGKGSKGTKAVPEARGAMTTQKHASVSLPEARSDQGIGPLLLGDYKVPDEQQVEDSTIMDASQSLEEALVVDGPGGVVYDDFLAELDDVLGEEYAILEQGLGNLDKPEAPKDGQISADPETLGTDQEKDNSLPAVLATPTQPQQLTTDTEGGRKLSRLGMKRGVSGGKASFLETRKLKEGDEEADGEETENGKILEEGTVIKGARYSRSAPQPKLQRGPAVDEGLLNSLTEAMGGHQRVWVY